MGPYSRQWTRKEKPCVWHNPHHWQHHQSCHPSTDLLHTTSGCQEGLRPKQQAPWSSPCCWVSALSRGHCTPTKRTLLAAAICRHADLEVEPNSEIQSMLMILKEHIQCRTKEIPLRTWRLNASCALKARRRYYEFQENSIIMQNRKADPNVYFNDCAMLPDSIRRVYKSCEGKPDGMRAVL